MIGADVLRSGHDKGILIWDAATCHVSAAVKEKAKSLKIDEIMIPAGMTNLLQPADVCWFKTFKQSFRRKWMNWYINDVKSFTNQGNLRSPGYIKVIEWLSEIWSNFDVNLIRDSFDSCGITSQNDLHHSLATILEKRVILNEMVMSDNDEDDEDDEKITQALI